MMTGGTPISGHLHIFTFQQWWSLCQSQLSHVCVPWSICTSRWKQPVTKTTVPKMCCTGLGILRNPSGILELLIWNVDEVWTSTQTSAPKSQEHPHLSAATNHHIATLPDPIPWPPPQLVSTEAPHPRVVAKLWRWCQLASTLRPKTRPLGPHPASDSSEKTMADSEMCFCVDPPEVESIWKWRKVAVANIT